MTRRSDSCEDCLGHGYITVIEERPRAEGYAPSNSYRREVCLRCHGTGYEPELDNEEE